MELLKSHPWPGNVRELQHCIHRTMIFTRGHAIQAADLRSLFEPVDEGRASEPFAKDDETLAEVVWRYLSSHDGPRAYDQFLGKVEKLLLTEALRRAKGNQTHAARLLGIPRPTLHAKMQKHRLHGEGGSAQG